MEARLRPATADDQDAILALMADVIRSAIEAPHQAATIGNVTANLEAWKRQPDACVHLVAESAGLVVGVVLVKDFWNLCSLFVATAHQRSGLGRRLTLAALDACRQRSPIGAVHLNAAPSAVPFYTALGFSPRPSKQSLPPGFLPMGLAFAAGAAPSPAGPPS